VGEDINDNDRADAVLAPALLDLASQVKQAAARLRESSDGEAVHDFRVALRRLRTLLRPARRVYGEKRARAVAEDLRRFADATSALRDQEVLRETIDALDLPADLEQAFAAWKARRARQEQARRAKIIALLRAPSLDAALERLTLILRPGQARRRSARKLARRAIKAAIRGVRRRASSDPGDASAMHALRIRYKRLRYIAELFAPILGPSAEEIARIGARMQRRLGHLHDLDEAIERMRRARQLPPGARAVVRKTLSEARAAAGEEIQRDLVETKGALEQCLEEREK
jgi:CHAD domain-containing protein